MSNLPATLSYQQAIAHVDPGAVAAAEAVKARIQASFIMAMQRPRNYMQSRTRILDACRRPEFAQRVEYAKPVGGKQMKGPSIRFAELAVREWGNVNTEVQIVYEDDTVRRIKVTVIDLETNATFGKEVQIKKTVERKDGKGREIVGERTNSSGDPVFIVLATDEEVATKEAATISKIIRNEGLRLIPQDIIDEGIAVARETLRNRDAKDPMAALKNIVDHFAALNIGPKQLETYLGHGLEIISPAELQDLRGVYQAIHSGEASWADYITKEPKEDLNDLLKKPAAPQPPQAQPATTPTTAPQAQAAQPEPPAQEPPFDQGQQPPILQPEGNGKKRMTNKEYDDMRADMVMELNEKGVNVAEIEKEVGEYSTRWMPRHVEKIRGEILPRLLGE